MRARRIVQRNTLKKKIAFYKLALLGARDVITGQAEELRKHDPGSLIMSPTAAQITKVSNT